MRVVRVVWARARADAWRARYGTASHCHMVRGGDPCSKGGRAIRLKSLQPKGVTAMTVTANIQLMPADDVIGRRPGRGDRGWLHVHHDHGNITIVADSINQSTQQHFHESFTHAQARKIGQALLDAAGPEPVEVPRFKTAIEREHQASNVYIEALDDGDIWFHDARQLREKVGSRLAVVEARKIATALISAANNVIERRQS